MKKICSLSPLLIVSSFLLFSACKKSNDDVPGNPGGGPNVVLPTSGFLVTMGTSWQGVPDTLTYYFSTNGQQLSHFGYDYLKNDDEISFTNNSNGTITIQRKKAYEHNGKLYNKFGIEENASPDFSSFPANKYLFYFYHEQESALTQFVIKRNDSDKLKFTIESKAFPGYYLGCAKWKNATEPTTDRLVFTQKAKEFWFVQH